MDRRNFLRNIALGSLALAIPFKPAPKQAPGGILHYIHTQGTFVDYTPGSFSIADFNDLVMRIYQQTGNLIYYGGIDHI